MNNFFVGEISHIYLSMNLPNFVLEIKVMPLPMLDIIVTDA
jgi:hypothetical protein